MYFKAILTIFHPFSIWSRHDSTILSFLAASQSLTQYGTVESCCASTFRVNWSTESFKMTLLHFSFNDRCDLHLFRIWQLVRLQLLTFNSILNDSCYATQTFSDFKYVQEVLVQLWLIVVIKLSQKMLKIWVCILINLRFFLRITLCFFGTSIFILSLAGFLIEIPVDILKLLLPLTLWCSSFFLIVGSILILAVPGWKQLNLFGVKIARQQDMDVMIRGCWCTDVVKAEETSVWWFHNLVSEVVIADGCSAAGVATRYVLPIFRFVLNWRHQGFTPDWIWINFRELITVSLVL